MTQEKADKDKKREALKRGAFLREALKRGAELTGPELSKANLSNAKLINADLSGADLSGADLSNANLLGADLSGANLSGADLNHATLIKADLSGANLSGADLIYANLLEADLNHANLLEADLSHAILVGINLYNVKSDNTTKWPVRFDPLSRQEIISGGYVFELVGQELTPDNLATDIVPYLQAIAELQRIIEEINNLPHQDVKVNSITEGSAIISLEGATDAIELIMSVIVPWRYKHARAIAQLEESEKQAQIEKARYEIISNRKKLARGDKKEELELRKQQVEIENIELENEGLRLELHRKKIQLAFDVLHEINPELSEIDKTAYAIKLLKPIETLIASDLEPQ